jgi:hypothetical protein
MPERSIAGQGAQTDNAASTPPADAADKPRTPTDEVAGKGLMDFLDIPPELQPTVAAKPSAQPGTPTPPSESDIPMPPEESPDEEPEKPDEEEADEEQEPQETPTAEQQPQKIDKRQKRINRLTRQKSELQSKLDEASAREQQLLEHLTQLQQREQEQFSAAPGGPGPLGHIRSSGQLEREVASAEANLAWCDLNRDGILTPDGSDYAIVTEGPSKGQKATPELVAEWRKAAEQKILFAPRRAKELERFELARNQYDQLAASEWPELTNPQSIEYKTAVQLLKQFPFLAGLPEANYAVGLILDGMKLQNARQQSRNGQLRPKAHRDISESAFSPRVPIAPSAPEAPIRSVAPSSRKQLDEAMSNLTKDVDGSVESLANVFNAMDKARATRPTSRTQVRS